MKPATLASGVVEVVALRQLLPAQQALCGVAALGDRVFAERKLPPPMVAHLISKI
jgi:hypothetical protein